MIKMSTESYVSIEATVPTSTEWTSAEPSSLLPYKKTLLFLGVLGTLTNGFVLGGFWLSDRSKITSSSIHIINHTTLEPTRSTS